MLQSKVFLFYLAMLSITGFLATDMYLPAFTAMQRDLATSAGTISASLTVFLGGFACVQPLWGALSDHFGRKPVLIAGLSLFALGCVGMLWVKSAPLMLLLRFIQATGICSAAVSWQALVVDRYQGIQAKRIFATIMPLVALSPALAPLLGAWLLNHAGWRSLFFALLLIALMLLLLTFRLLPPLRPQPVAAKTSLRFTRLLATRAWSGNVLIYAACSASFFAWLTGSPFILHDLGLTPEGIGLSYLPQTIAFLLGGYGCRAALKRIEGKALLPGLIIFYSLTMLALYLVAVSGKATLTFLLIPFCGMALANGAIYPIVVANALLPFPQHTGKAAALQNTLQLGLCFFASLAVSTGLTQPLITTTTIMLSTIALAAGGYYWQRSK